MTAPDRGSLPPDEAPARSPYAPCAEVLFALPRSERARFTLHAAHLRCTGGDAVMAPQDEHVVICTLGTSSAITRTLDGRRDLRHPKAGSFSVVPAGCSARWNVHGASESLHLHVNAASVKRYLEQQDDVKSSASLHPTFAVTDAWLRGFYELLRAELFTAAASGASLRVFMEQAEQMLLRHLLRRSASVAVVPGQVAPLRPFLLARIRDYVLAHLGVDISLTLMAELAHMSPDHFLRAFAAGVGSTPYHWVVQQRIEAAAHLLLTTREPVAEIARRVGYRSASHFASQFRHRYLVTPTQYRQDRETPGPALR